MDSKEINMKKTHEEKRLVTQHSKHALKKAKGRQNERDREKTAMHRPEQDRRRRQAERSDLDCVRTHTAETPGAKQPSDWPSSHPGTPCQQPAGSHPGQERPRGPQHPDQVAGLGVAAPAHDREHHDTDHVHHDGGPGQHVPSLGSRPN